MSTAEGIWTRIKNAFHKEPIKTRLTVDEVVKVASSYLASQGGYTLREPYNVSIDSDKSNLVWHICDSVNTRGGNYHMLISDTTGEVVKTWATPM